MLELIKLKKTFGDVVALDGLSLRVNPGRIVGFLGPNGAGKTTAMRAVFGLVHPEGGQVLWDGKTLTTADRLRFGYMPEERGLYPKMRIREQIAYFGRLSGMDRDAAEQAAAHWLGRFDLSDRSYAKLEELSHGNQQRVQLAAALVHDPVLAVLDEPFAGLDPIGMDTMAEEMRRLARSGVAILFSSHQLDLVADICQDVVIINEGRAVLSGEVNRLRTMAPTRFLEIEVDGEPWFADLPGIEVTDRNGAARYVMDRQAPISSILEQARAAGEVTRFSYEPPHLTDLFREAVGR
jgi:ABC-2 type transport system ATP-binding protein